MSHYQLTILYLQMLILLLLSVYFTNNIFQFVLLFVVSVVLVTPVSLYSVVTPISTSLQSQEGSIWYSLGEALQSNSSPLMIALCNVIIIPFLVDRVAEY